MDADQPDPDNQSPVLVRSMRIYSLAMAAFLAILVATAVWRAITAPTIGGSAIAWFVAFLAGAFLAWTLGSLLGLVHGPGRPRRKA